MKEFAARTALLVLGLALALVATEVALRFAVPHGGSPPVHQPHPRLGHELRPGVDMFHVWDAGESRGTIRTNSDGFRGPETPREKPEREFRILLLGDSYTFGYGVDEEEVFGRRLEAKLKAAGSPWSYVVVNGGVSSYGTAHELLQFELKGRHQHADLVLLNFFMGNDIQDNLCVDYLELRPHRRVPCFELKDGDLEEQTPKQTVKSGMNKRSMVSATWSRLKRSRTYELVEQRGHRLFSSNPGIARMLYRLGLPVHPGYLPHVVSGWYVPEHADPGWAVTRALIERLHSDVARSGARLGVVMIPSRVQVLPKLIELSRVLYADTPAVQRFLENPGLPQERLGGFLDSMGIPSLDLRPVIQEADTSELYFPVIAHWNRMGHEVAADAIFKFLRTQNLLAESPGRL